jgi:hypothetical protein
MSTITLNEWAKRVGISRRKAEYLEAREGEKGTHNFMEGMWANDIESNAMISGEIYVASALESADVSSLHSE